MSNLFAIFVLIILQKRYFMDTLGERIQAFRKQNGLSQTQLADKLGISYAQLSRYEIKNIQPPADVLGKLADIFGTSIDYLVNGDNEQKAKTTIQNAELLNEFKEIDKLPDNEKFILLKVIRAYRRDFKAQQSFGLA